MHFTGFAFLKTYQKQKKGGKKLDIYQTPLNCPPLQADNLSPSAPALSS